MAKDPAFLFYFRDFLVSTDLMDPADVGRYIHMLCHMADKGRLTMGQMRQICGSKDVPDAILLKLKQDEKGLFYNVRLEEEMLKRSNFTTSRLNNLKAHKVDHMATHMGNANANGNRSDKAVKKDVIKAKKPTTFVRDNPPTLEEVTKYCLERKNGIDPQAFIDKNTTVGWVDKNKIPYRDWKAVIRTWENYRKATGPTPQAVAPMKRPAMIVVVEKIAAGMDDNAIWQDLAGKYTQHEITEALMRAHGKVE